MMRRQRCDKRVGPLRTVSGGFIAALTSLLLHTATLQAQAVIQPVDGESSVRFSIRNFGINVQGRLRGLKGEIVFDPAQLGSSRFQVSLKSNTVETGNRLRDEHLKKRDYLDAVGFPEIFFRSTAVRQGATADVWLLTGILTIKGTSKPVEIPFQAEKSGPGYRFTGSFRINRLDFKVGDSSISLSDNLTISLEIISR